MAVSTNSNWPWVIVIGVCVVTAWMSYSKRVISLGDIVTAVTTLVFYGVLFFISGSLLYRFIKPLLTRHKPPSNSNDNGCHSQKYAETRNNFINELQDETDKKTESYKERILKPREEMRQRVKEERLQNVVGKEFTGHGDKLGGELVKDAGAPNDSARDHRTLPESVRLHIPASEGKPVKRKRVIKLPDEPAEDDPDVVVVTIHTILDQRHTRRFLYSTQLQVVFDYMVTLGFSAATYTLAWSHPRRVLTGEPNHTLADLGFDRRTLLFVQERDDE